MFQKDPSQSAPKDSQKTWKSKKITHAKNHVISKLVAWRSHIAAIQSQPPPFFKVQWFLGQRKLGWLLDPTPITTPLAGVFQERLSTGALLREVERKACGCERFGISIGMIFWNDLVSWRISFTLPKFNSSPLRRRLQERLVFHSLPFPPFFKGDMPVNFVEFIPSFGVPQKFK